MPTAWSVTEHYENFPVGSRLLPAHQRGAVAALYRFARYADDVADEGDAPAAERLAELAALDAALMRLGAGAAPGHAVVEPLAPHVARLGLPVRLLRDLLSAFSQDAAGARFADYAALRDYCRRSADPVGRLMLRIGGVDDARADALSDRICSALQLINFAQDFALDRRRGRRYVPDDEWRAAGLDEAALDCALARAAPAAPRLRTLLAAQTARARALLESGAPLAARVPRRLGWEIGAIVAGGLRLCDRLAAPAHDALRAPVRLGARDALPIAALAWRLRPRRLPRGQTE